MRAFVIISIFASLTWIQSSCEKVIDLDLNADDPQYVIEGIINKDSLTNTVNIRRTLNFDENENFPTVDNATVQIKDDQGNSETLQLVSPGMYRTQNFPGVEGRTYTLTVTVDGKVFEAKSTLPQHVVLDTVMLEEFAFGPKPVYYPVPVRIDPAGVKNYYRFDLFKNKERVNGIFIQDDQFADGVEMLEPVFGGDYESKDTLFLNMFCIDAAVHKYFYTLEVNSQGTSGATPANPESNFSNKALGYFSAQSKQSMQLIVP